MKSLRDKTVRNEIIQRLQKIRPESQRRWGSMSAHQMVCHLSDSFRLYMGDLSMETAPMKVPRALLKWTALWAPIPWPKGFKTAPEMDQQAKGTRPQEFAGDMAKLRGLIEQFSERPREFTWRHPHFGTMSEGEWMRLAYLHANHHLRQFGA